MKLTDFLKIRYSAFVLVVCGAALCYLSYRLGALRNKELNSREDQLYAFLLTAAVPATLGFTSWSISREIEEVAGKEKEDAQTGKREALGRYKAIYSTSIEELKEGLEPLRDSSEIYLKCMAAIEQCQSSIKQFEKKEKASGEIANWLSFKKNRAALRDYAVSFVPQLADSVSVQTLQIFRNDIGRCINWLRDSIAELCGYDVDPSQLARVQADLPDKLHTYTVALNAIKTYETLSELSGDSGVLEDFVDELIRRLNLDRKP